jgi:hypothetical protein
MAHALAMHAGLLVSGALAALLLGYGAVRTVITNRSEQDTPAPSRPTPHEYWELRELDS